MTLDEFHQSLTATDRQPNSRTRSPDCGGCKGDWKRAHEAAQQDEDRGSWVHAYLHRKEAITQ